VLVATARIVPPGLKYAEPAIGRVVTAPEVRRQGVGRALMLEAIAQLKRLYPGQGIRLSAQRYLEAFYRSLGFVAEGEPYEEDGIPHVEMLRE
jgi:ElaA protein